MPTRTEGIKLNSSCRKIFRFISKCMSGRGV